jgi:hypothetical protein
MSNPTDPIVPPIYGRSAETDSSANHSGCKYADDPTFQLISWKDPVKTGKIFGVIVVALAALKKGNPINWFFHVAFLALLAAGIVEYASKLVTGQGLVSKYRPPQSKSCAKTFNEKVLPTLGDVATKLEDKLHRIIYAQDTECTLKAAGLSYIIYKITSWFSIFTLIATAVVLVFTVPAVYSRNKKEIDAIVAEYTKLIKQKTCELTKDARKAAGPHVKNILEKAGTVGALVKSKFPTRTAGSTVGETSGSKFGTEADKPSATTTGSSQFPNVSKSEVKSAIDDVTSAHAGH